MPSVSGPISGPPPQQLGERRPRERHVSRHPRDDRDRPVGELVPRQQVPGEARRGDRGEEHEADEPVERAPVEEACREEDAEHVEGGDEDQQVRAPVVERADEGPEEDLRLEPFDRRVCLARHRRVAEHEQRAREHEGCEEDERHPPEAERVREADCRPGDAHRSEVEHERRDDGPRPVAVGFRYCRQSPEPAQDAAIGRSLRRGLRLPRLHAPHDTRFRAGTTGCGAPRRPWAAG